LTTISYSCNRNDRICNGKIVGYSLFVLPFTGRVKEYTRFVGKYVTGSRKRFQPYKVYICVSENTRFAASWVTFIVFSCLSYSLLLRYKDCILYFIITKNWKNNGLLYYIVAIGSLAKLCPCISAHFPSPTLSF